MTMLRRMLLISLCTAVVGNNGAQAFCTCWDSGMGPAATPEKSSPGSHCAGGIDWDTARVSYRTCQTLCAKLWPPEYNWAYVDQIAFNKCKTQNPSKIILPTQDQKDAVEKVYKCETDAVWGSLMAAIFFFGVGGLAGFDALNCKDFIDKLKPKVKQLETIRK